VINPSNINLDNSEIEISICHSPMSPFGGAEVGVEIKHIGTGIIVRSVELRTQHKNKLAALELLAKRLLKMSNDKMLTFKLITYKNELRFGVTIPVIEAEIKRKYEQGEAKAFIRKFHDMMLGSTVSKVNNEIAIYPNDIAAIFEQLSIPIKFINDKGDKLAIYGSGSGIYGIPHKDMVELNGECYDKTNNLRLIFNNLAHDKHKYAKQ